MNSEELWDSESNEQQNVFYLFTYLVRHPQKGLGYAARYITAKPDTLLTRDFIEEVREQLEKVHEVTNIVIYNIIRLDG